MNQNLRLSNYNYDASQLLDRIRNLFERDRYFFGPILQRSALTRTPSGEVQHCITRIDILPQNAAAPAPEVLDYGTMIFVLEVLDEEVLVGLEVVILHEQPNRGDTIIEKFQLHSDVAFAIALLTGDDEARVATSEVPLKRRARQNVLFEFGYFIGTLGRSRVCALVETGVEIPSDYQGVIFIPLDPSGYWKFALIKEMKTGGLDLDANRAL